MLQSRLLAMGPLFQHAAGLVKVTCNLIRACLSLCFCPSLSLTLAPAAEVLAAAEQLIPMLVRAPQYRTSFTVGMDTTTGECIGALFNLCMSSKGTVRFGPVVVRSADVRYSVGAAAAGMERGRRAACVRGDGQRQRHAGSAAVVLWPARDCVPVPHRRQCAFLSVSRSCCWC
jgi:hypothetical protein